MQSKDYTDYCVEATFDNLLDGFAQKVEDATGLSRGGLRLTLQIA